MTPLSFVNRERIASGNSMTAAVKKQATATPSRRSMPMILRIPLMSFAPQYWAVKTAEPLRRPNMVTDSTK